MNHLQPDPGVSNAEAALRGRHVDLGEVLGDLRRKVRDDQLGVVLVANLKQVIL